MKRMLIYVPILHTVSDMGTLAGSMREAYVKRFGERKWKEHVRVIDEMWEGIQRKIQDLRLPYKKVKVYQDGLPVCGKEREIIRDLAAKGSPNHRLVAWLLDQGATIVGTEDPHLLLEEYHHIKRITQSRNHNERERLTQEFKEEEAGLLRKRDETIRNQIDRTLKRGEIGILFIGLLHRVDEILPPDLKAQYLIHRLPFRRSFEIEMVA